MMKILMNGGMTMNESEVVTISKIEYNDLLDDQKLLLCLQSAGVDNWLGYDFALEMYLDDDV